MVGHILSNTNKEQRSSTVLKLKVKPQKIAPKLNTPFSEPKFRALSDGAIFEVGFLTTKKDIFNLLNPSKILTLKQ